MIYFKMLLLLLLLDLKAVASSASNMSLSELADLSSGSIKGYKIAAKGAKDSGGFNAWAESQGGNSEAYKDDIDATALNTAQAITNVKNTLGGVLNASLILDAQAIKAQVVGLQGQVTQITAERDNLTTDIENGITSIAPAQATLPASIASVKQELNGVPGNPLIQDAQAINAQVVELQGQVTQITAERDNLTTDIENGITSIAPAQATLPASIASVKQELNGVPGNPLIQDAQAINAQVVELQGQVTQITAERDNLTTDIENGITSIAPAQATLPASIASVKQELNGVPGNSLIQDAQAVNAQVVGLQGQVTQLSDQLDNLNNDLGQSINKIDAAGTTLPDAVTRVLDTPNNYALAWNSANFINQNFTTNAGSGDPDDASLRNQLIVLYNILNFIKPVDETIKHIDDAGTVVTQENVTLADMIGFLKDFISLQKN
jgi:chaperonin cofactor prefoldin